MKFFKIFLPVITALFIMGCEEKSDNLPAFANPKAPEYRALMFFEAIYNQKNVGKAQKYATDKLSRILRSYGSTRAYARYVLNLQIDKGADLKIDRSLNQVTTDVALVTSVNVLFTGTHNEEPVNDVRKVNFVKVDGDWLIDNVEDDPYMKR